MQLCGERQVALSFLSENGRFWARVEGPVSGNVLLRLEHYRRADDEQKSGEIARSAVIGKIVNSRTVLLRALRDHPDKTGSGEIEETSQQLARALNDLRQEVSLATVRGVEGDAARRYFSVFDRLVTAQKEDFFFRERSRRPPLDNMNSLLSFLYTLLVHDVASALESVGLDPAVGFLHRDRPGRPRAEIDLETASNISFGFQ